MSDRHVIVLGAGGHAKVVIATLQAAGRAVDGILDDDDALQDGHILGVPVIGRTDCAPGFRHLDAIIAVGDNGMRQKLAEKVNLDWTVVVHPSAVVHPEVTIGPGTVVFAGAVIQPGARIGAHTIINTGATVDHDCVVGDYVHIAPGVHLGGTVTVDDGVFVGIGSALLPNIHIGRWAKLGAGTVAINDIEPRAVAVGVPSRYVRRNGQPARSLPTVCISASAKRTTSVHATFIRPSDARWGEVLRCARHDFYHLPEYLELCGRYENGEPVAFYAEDGLSACLIPLLLKRIPESIEMQSSWYDIVSPYGYPCPLYTQQVDADRVSRYLKAFQEVSAEIGVCSAFLRLHPLLEAPAGIAPLTTYVGQGETASIDLTLSVDEMWRQTRHDHRKGIRRLERLKFVSVMDDWTLYEDFMRMYRETMVRVGADPFYQFCDEYFRDLKHALGDQLHLCCAKSSDGCLAGGALFTTIDDIMQTHLSGDDAKYHRLAPTKLLMHYARAWGKRRGHTTLHLGGGVGSRKDSLFEFKAGFSPNRHVFRTLRMVMNERRYAALMLRAGRLLSLPDDLAAPYFPPYQTLVEAKDTGYSISQHKAQLA
jgi:sugar O-acyltransferase (sialic acid O-acetyltransferase NeuD family)